MIAMVNAETLLKYAGTLAGAVVSIWGAISIVLKIVKAVKDKHNEPYKEIATELDAIKTELKNLTDATKENSDAIATLQCDTLNGAFVKYVDKGVPCPMSVKTSLSEMYRQYTKDGRHNHVAADYIERLMECPAD